MKDTLWIAAFLAFTAHIVAEESRQYRESDLQRTKSEWIEVAQHITIGEFRFVDETQKEILSYIEREAKIGDKKGKGIEFYIPAEFETQFAKNADEKWTIQLADGLDMFTIFAEWSPHGWMYFPIEPRRIAVIPRDALIRDLTGNEK